METFYTFPKDDYSYLLYQGKQASKDTIYYREK